MARTPTLRWLAAAADATDGDAGTLRSWVARAFGG
jgi:hypothetical protein